MKFKGKINEILSQISARFPEFDLKKEYICEIKLYRKDRSLNANAYYWLLIGKYADWMKLPKQRVHNMILEAYGQ